KEKVMISPARQLKRDMKNIDEAIIAIIPNRTHKAQAPKPLVPSNRFGSPDGSVRHFMESRAMTEQFLKNASQLGDHMIDGPVSKMDGYEFVLFIAAHCEQHTKQINEVKADPNFPKN